MEPNYAPNVVNQTVDFGGFTWKGNPGSGWTKVGVTGQQAPSTQPQADPMDLVKQAQQYQVQQNQPAIATLQGQQTSLQQQYKDLLDSVTKQGNVGIDTATRNQNAFLASRGIYSQGGIGGDQISQAQSQAGAQAASQEAAVQTQGAQDINALAAQIAGLQAGNVPNALGFSSNIASLANALQVANIQNQRPFGVQPGQGVFNPATGQFSPYSGPAPVNAPSTTVPTPTVPINTNVNNGNTTQTPTATTQQQPAKTPLNLASTVAAANMGNQPQAQGKPGWLGSDLVSWWNNLWNTGPLNTNNVVRIGQ